MVNANKPDDTDNTAWFTEKIEQALLSGLQDLGACSSGTGPGQAGLEGRYEDSKSFLVAVSGGIDSTALLIALHKLAGLHGWRISACHINHNLRGEESDKDEDFCRRLCEMLDIPIFCARLEAAELWQRQPGEASSRTYPSENLLRELRYANLLLAAKEHEIKMVVTGHTLDDQAETILFRLLRGTSPSGLLAMEGMRELFEGENVYLLRPMLKLSKADCQRFLASQEVAARIDSSNFDEHYSRNFLRTRVEPLLSQRFPGWQKRIDRFRTILQEEDDLLERLTSEKLSAASGEDEQGFYISLPILKTADPAIQRRIVSRLLKRNEVEASFERISLILELIKHKTGAMSLSSMCEVRVADDKLRWTYQGEEADDLETDLEAPSPFMRSQRTIINLPESDKKFRSTVITWLNKSLQVEKWLEQDEFSFPDCNDFELLADLSHAHLPLVLRYRKAGDRIQPFGMSEPVRLKKYLHTHKKWLSGKKSTGKGAAFTQSQRYAIVLADNQEVLWIPGVGISEKLRVKKKPTHRLRFVDLSSGTGLA